VGGADVGAAHGEAMSTTIETCDGPGGILTGVRGPFARRTDLVLAAVGRLAYSAFLWLLAVAVVPMLWGWSPTVLESGSMAPTMRAGDVLIASSHSGEGLGPGTIIVFRVENARSPVAHRIVDVTPDGAYLTRGDANAGIDSTPVQPAEIEGVGRMLVPYAGLPSHWLRTGRWPDLAGLVATMGLAVWLAYRMVPVSRRQRAGWSLRRWAAVGGVTALLLGATGATALAAFSDTIVNSTNGLAAGTWAGIADIAAGEEHSCAVLVDGTAWCWGENGRGQLGDGTTTDRSTATQVVGPGGTGHLADVAGITAGREHTCAALDDGTAWCWGENGRGQLGTGNTTDSRYPVQVDGIGGSGTLAGVDEIEADREHTCALLSAGTMACWGENGRRQLGDGTTTDRRSPVQVVGSGGAGTLGSVAGFGLGEQHTCAVLDDGSAWCWGEGSQHRLGNGSTTDRGTPTQVKGTGGSGNLAGVAQIDGGNEHTCAVLTDGSVRCWGRNNQGELGIGSHAGQAYPVQADGRGGSGTLAGVDAVYGGRDHTCALHGDGSVSCWGRNDSGQVGDGTTTERTSPVQVVGAAGVGTYADGFLLSVGSHHACSARSVDEAWCWGRNDRLQLGDGTTTNRSCPVQVSGL
jgi:signal peptidase I